MSITISIRANNKVIKLIRKFNKTDTIATVKLALIDQEYRDYSIDKINLQKGKVLKNEKTLQYYKILRSATLSLIFKVIGGMAQQLDDDEKYQNEFNKHKNKKYDEKRIIDLEFPGTKLSNKECAHCYANNSHSVQRAEMECGCSICPNCMLKLIKSIYGKYQSDYDVECPYHKEVIWEFQLCLNVATLDDDDFSYYDQQYDIRSSPETKNCPNCQELCERPEDLKKFRVNCTNCNGADWCWLCQEKWNSSSTFSYCGNPNCFCAEINETLKNCPMKDTTYHIDNDNNKAFVQVPTIRACIKCYCFIQHSDACKHMKCPDCKQEFCFACLQPKGSNGWPCGAHYNECPIADRQQLK